MPRWKECRHPPFLSTLSLRRATLTTVLHWYHISRFLSTLSLRRATQQKSGDGKAYVDFYPRSPCGERHTPVKAYNIIKGFLSTLSLRRATQFRRWTIPRDRNFYPRSPCGERPVVHQSDGQSGYISIHALLAESDDTSALVKLLSSGFLSTLSLRRATRHHQRPPGSTGHFYPRSPCGERLFASRTLPRPRDFYPRSPCGERPDDLKRNIMQMAISIHALLAESDGSLYAI